MNPLHDDSSGRDIRAMAPAIVRGAALVLGAMLLALVLADLYSGRQSRRYEAETRIGFFDQATSSLGSAGSRAFNQDAEVDEQLLLLRDEALLPSIPEAAGAPDDLKLLPTRAGGEVIVRVESSSPDRIAEIADAIAARTIELRQSQIVGRTDELLAAYTDDRDQLQGRLDALNDQLAQTTTDAGARAAIAADPTQAPSVQLTASEDVAYLNAKRDQLFQERRDITLEFNTSQRQVDLLEADKRLQLVPAKIIERAEQPKGSFSPRVMRNRLLLMAVAALGALGLAQLWFRLDSRVRTTSMVEAAVPEHRVFGTLPRPVPVPFVDDALSGRPPFAARQAEAHKALAAKLRYGNYAGTARIIGVTSPGDGERSSTIAVGLGRALAETGDRVVVVSTRFSGAARRSSAVPDSEIGLATILQRGAPDAVAEALAASVRQTIEGPGELFTLSPGSDPARAVGLLRREHLAGVLSGILSAVDFVIVDCAPVLSNAETLVVSQSLDAVLVVAKAGATTSPELSEACAQLVDVGAPVLGVIFRGPVGAAAAGQDFGSVDEEPTRTQYSGPYEVVAPLDLRERRAAVSGSPAVAELPRTGTDGTIQWTE